MNHDLAIYCILGYNYETYRICSLYHKLSKKTKHTLLRRVKGLVLIKSYVNFFTETNRRDYLGGDASKGEGGSIYTPGAKKLGYFYTFSAPKAPQNFLSTFL